MQINSLPKVPWIRILLFFVSCALSVYSVYANNVLLALLATLVMFITFVSWQKKSSRNEEKAFFKRYELTSDQLILSLALLLYSVVSGIVAVFLSPKISNGTISLIFWAISISLLVSSGLVFDKNRPFRWREHYTSLDSKSRKKVILEISAVTAITAIALILRVLFLDRYPPSVHGDEGEMGMEALRFLGIGEPISPFSNGWGPHPNLFYLMQSGFIAIFGRNLIGLRMVSPLFGTACVPLVYLIGKKCWGKLAGFSGAWLIAISSINIQFSRLALNNIHSLFFMLLFVWFFLQSNGDNPQKNENEPDSNKPATLEKQNYTITPYIAMGITMALAQYMYVGARLIPLVAFPLILYQLIRKRINLVQLSVLIISAVLVFAPLGLDFIQNPDHLTARINTVSIFNPDNIQNNYGPDATLSNSLGKILISQFNKNLGFFLKSGDSGAFYFQGVPGFDFITSILFWLGLGIILTRPKRPPELTIIIWFFLGIILAGVVTNDSPNSTRLLILSAVPCLCGGVFIQKIWDSIYNLYKQIPDTHISLAAILAPVYLIFIAIVLMLNYHYYFVVYTNSGVNILPITVAKEVIQDSPNNHVYLFGKGEFFARHGTIRYLVGDNKVSDIQSLSDIPELKEDGKGITVLATSANYEEFSQIQSLYPQGKLTDVYQYGILLFKKFQLSALP